MFPEIAARSDIDAKLEEAGWVVQDHKEMNSSNRHERTEYERFKAFADDDLVKRDKANLDLFWLKDDSLEDSANLPAPDVLAAEIVEDLEAALAQFALIAGDLAAPKS